MKSISDGMKTQMDLNKQAIDKMNNINSVTGVIDDIDDTLIFDESPSEDDSDPENNDKSLI